MSLLTSTAFDLLGEAGDAEDVAQVWLPQRQHQAEPVPARLHATAQQQQQQRPAPRQQQQQQRHDKLNKTMPRFKTVLWCAQWTALRALEISWCCTAVTCCDCSALLDFPLA